MPECSNQITSERAQLLAAMTYPSRVLNLDVKQSFFHQRAISNCRQYFFFQTNLYLQLESYY